MTLASKIYLTDFENNFKVVLLYAGSNSIVLMCVIYIHKLTVLYFDIPFPTLS